jgi:hypothetical protein
MFNIKSYALKITALFFLASTIQSANAAEINMPGLNGSFTSTVTSGFSMRVADRDCKLLDGYNTDAYSYAGSQAARTANSQDSTLDSIVSGSGFGCQVQELILMVIRPIKLLTLVTVRQMMVTLTFLQAIYFQRLNLFSPHLQV